MTYRPRLSDQFAGRAHWWHRFQISTQKLAIVLTVSAVVSGFAYVMITNSTAAQGFAIKDLQGKIASAQEQNQKLELEADSVRTLATVQAASAQFQLQPTDSFQYLASGTSSVAVR